MKKFILLVFLGTFCFTSCDKVESPQRVINIDKEFTIEMIEVLSPDQNSLAFNITTIENQECLNSSITFSASSRTELIRIILEGINTPENCVSGNQLISSTIPFSTPNDQIEVEIQLSDVINNNGKIEVNEDGNQYSLTMETEHGFRISNTVLNTIPKGYFWGYIGTNNIQIINAFEGFLNEISNEGIDAIFSDGNYGHFNIDNQNIDKVKGKEDLQNEVIFLKELTGSKEQIEQIAEEFRVQYGTDLVLKVFTSEGEIY